MWAKRIVRVLAATYVVAGAVTLFAPESMGRFARWFVNHPLYMRIDGLLAIALGVFLGLREYREEQPPPPWWRRILR